MVLGGIVSAVLILTVLSGLSGPLSQPVSKVGVITHQIISPPVVAQPPPVVSSPDSVSVAHSVSWESAKVSPRPSAAEPTWTNITPLTSPPTTSGAMAYDPPRGALILFGGYEEFGNPAIVPENATNYTWEYANDTWTNISSSVGVAPSPEVGGSLVYDASDGYLVLWGGLGQRNCQNAYGCNATWILDSTGWREVQSPAGLGQPGNGAPMAYDSTDGYVLLYDGYYGTWAYNGGRWTSLGTPPRYAQPGNEPWLSSMSDDPANRGVVLFGGPLNQTWFFSAGNWSNVTSIPFPLERSGAAMAYDSVDGYVLMYGGDNSFGSSGSSFFNYADTWQFGSGNWTQLNPTTTPGLRGYASIAFDPGLDAVILYGGWCHTADGGMIFLHDTWLWGSSPPIASVVISPSASTSEVGVAINFTAIVVGGIAPFTYSWSFGDGNTSFVPTPSHAYSRQGSYAVQVTVTAADGQQGIGAALIDVNAALSLQVTAQPNPTDPGIPVHFNASTLGGTSPILFSWLFGDGDSSTQSSPLHAFIHPGVYLTQVWANDSSRVSARFAVSVRVNAPLSVGILSVDPNPAVLGSPVNFSASVSGGTLPYHLSWMFGDGGLGGNLSNITHIFTTNGPFVATVQAVDGVGAVESANVSVTIQFNVSISASVGGGFAPLSVNFTSTVAGGDPAYHYNWTFGDGNYSSAVNPSHAFLTAGSYVVQLRVSDASGHFAASSLTIRASTTPASGKQGGAAGFGPFSLETYSLFGFLVFVALIGGIAVGRSLTRPKEGTNRARQGYEGYSIQITSSGPDKPSPTGGSAGGRAALSKDSTGTGKLEDDPVGDMI